MPPPCFTAARPGAGRINAHSLSPKEEPTTRVNVFAGMYDGPRNKAANVYEGRNQGMAGTNSSTPNVSGRDVVLGANPCGTKDSLDLNCGQGHLEPRGSQVQ